MNNGIKSICMVIGDPVSHSLGPLVHNAAYKALGIDDKFVYTAARVQQGDLSDAMKGVRVLGIRSLSCTLPLKHLVLQYLDEIDEEAKEIGAVNTVILEDGKLKGYNTDIDGVVQPFLKRTTLRDKKVLVLGAGGAARSAVFGFFKEGAKVTLTNRSFEKGEKLATEIGVDFFAWEERAARSPEYDLIFNATSLGFDGNTLSALDKSAFRKGQIVSDAVYNPYQTPFLQNAASAGAEIIYGTEMFIEQAAKQILLYAGLEPPRGVMEQALMEVLCKR
ncbi:MAG: shikimate dehydrogenase [Bdellovibrionota bacterium]|jgi:shikimate dehydrogenase